MIALEKNTLDLLKEIEKEQKTLQQGVLLFQWANEFFYIETYEIPSVGYRYWIRRNVEDELKMGVYVVTHVNNNFVIDKKRFIKISLQKETFPILTSEIKPHTAYMWI